LRRKSKKKRIHQIKKCPANKSIRDYEIKHQKAKEHLEFTEFKLNQVTEEIDATKSILFKTQFKRMNETLIRQNEAEKVLLYAMNNLLENIPDISNEEVDNIQLIKYTNYEETSRICTRASKKLSRISTTRIKIESTRNQTKVVYETPLEAVEPPSVIVAEKPAKPALSRIKSRVVKPAPVRQEQEKQPIEETTNLYPCLQSLNTSMTQLNLKYVPPPTYSDSESFYKENKINTMSPAPALPKHNKFQNEYYNFT